MSDDTTATPLAQGEPSPAHRPSLRPVPVHPVLLAVVPVLALWAHNATEGIGIRDVIEPLAIIVGGAVAVSLIAAAFLRRDLRRGALAGSVVVFLVFSYGPLASALSALPSGAVIGMSAAVCVVAIAAMARARPERIVGLTKGVNFVAAGLVVFNVASIAVNGEATFTPTGLPGVLARAASGGAPHGRPDIYFIVLDEYGGETAMRQLLGFDDRPFLDELQRRGFYLPARPTTNYPRTLPYLAATLNLVYVQSLVPRGNKLTDATMKALITDDAVPKFLKSKGYRYIHIGSWISSTAKNPQADRNVVLGHGLSEFSNALLGQTVAAPALEALGSPAFDKQQYERAQFQFDQLAQSAKLAGGPKFVFSHILVPHWPYVFGANGEFTPSHIRMRDIKLPFDQVSPTVHQLYVDQVEFVNRKVLGLLDTLLAGPPESRPIVILQSDEGFFTWLFGGAEATDRDLLQHFNTLAAYYFPGLKDAGLYPTMTPVNTFRVVFNQYFRANLPLLPDRNYVLTNHDKAYVDVTDRVRSVL